MAEKRNQAGSRNSVPAIDWVRCRVANKSYRDEARRISSDECRGLTQFLIRGYLRLGASVHIGAALPSCVPFNGPFESIFEAKPGRPAKFRAGLAGIQSQQARLVYSGIGIADPAGAIAVKRGQPGGNLSNWPRIF